MMANQHHDFEPSADELIANNARFAVEAYRPLPRLPDRNLVVVTCMDARLDPLALLGLVNGQAHILRNAGGVITDDVIRSLALSQRYLETREILLIHHSDCGLEGLDEAEFRHELAQELGVTPTWSLESFRDPVSDVSQSMRRLQMTPFLIHKDNIRGFVYDVANGKLTEVQP